jgi:O-antigen ligase
MPSLSASQSIGRSVSSLELTFLAITFFTLPILEAPKNVASVLFLVTFLIQAIRYRNLGWTTPFDWPVIGLTLVLWVSPFLSEFSDHLSVLDSAPRWTLLGLFVLAAGRLNYTVRDIKILILALLIGGLVALFDGLYAWSINHAKYPEFRSVGHVNHSVMYSFNVFAVGIATLIGRDIFLKVIGVAAVAAMLMYLPLSRSIVGLGTMVAITAVASLTTAYVMRKLGYLAIGGLMIFVIAASVLVLPVGQDMRAELVSRVTDGNLWSGRDRILNSALEVYDHHPLIGTGFRSFGLATAEEIVRAEVEGDGRDYEAIKDRYWFFNHGHNLWTNTLIERGVLGLILITWLLLAYFLTFVPIALRGKGIDRVDRSLAVAGVLVAVGFCVGGLGNTTMMNEHGQAGMALIAICYGYLRGRGQIGAGERV